ncbi:NYN domain-containing protein [Rudaeicoccus suwonensis]|uniref:NYN domain-containing protein n=2 Tax=Rudaeicoccus suwonensis TaxID=657409 RepID=A0A561E4C2_9MICO|nr:NYN domain-containing protein [Rudaeicoccus suwonensis]
MYTAMAEALPLKKRALRGRRLVLVDIENEIGGAVIDEAEAALAQHAIDEAICLAGCDQVVIGVSHIGVLPTYLGWPGCRIVVRSGPDGADLALLEVLNKERIAERFDEVVLASGDAIFADAVAALGAAGVSVTVLTRIGSCSRQLRMAAGKTVYVDACAARFGGVA